MPNLNIPEKFSDLVSNGPEPARLIGSASTIDDFTNQNPQRTVGKGAVGPSSDMAQQPGIVRENAQDATLQTSFTSQSKNIIPISDTASVKASSHETTTIEKVNLNNIDLNHVYCDSQECIETPERDHVSVNPSVGSLNCPLWMKQDSHKSSPPQTSGNSGSTSSQSLSSSSEEAQVQNCYSCCCCCCLYYYYVSRDIYLKKVYQRQCSGAWLPLVWGHFQSDPSS